MNKNNQNNKSKYLYFSSTIYILPVTCVYTFDFHILYICLVNSGAKTSQMVYIHCLHRPAKRDACHKILHKGRPAC